jgi:hypothetical protein
MLIFGLFGPNSGYAQPMTTSTPTTKILAIGTINPGVDPAKLFAILPNEVRDTLDLYLNGKIDQWYSQQERRGVVFILNVTDPAAARDMLEKLPLALLAIDHAHTLLGTACISSSSAALKLRSPGAAPL